MFKKLLIVCLILVFSINLAYSADKWKEGTDADVVAGADSPSDIDTLLESGAFNPLQRMLATYVNGCTGTITSDAIYTVSAGEVACMNAGGVIRMRRNTSTTTVTNTSADVGGLDTGALAINTWYYIYAVADADATTFTAIMSASAANPTNGAALYYKLIGCALTDGTSDWLKMYWSGDGNDVAIMFDVPISITSTLSDTTWSAATSCAAGMPAISTMGIFGLFASDNYEASAVIIRPNGSTWSTSVGNGAYIGAGGASVALLGVQRMCMTDSSQQIQYYNDTGDNATAIYVEGFVFQR